jgi:hypothetical protein
MLLLRTGDFRAALMEFLGPMFVGYTGWPSFPKHFAKAAKGLAGAPGGQVASQTSSKSNIETLSNDRLAVVTDQ